MPPRALSVEDWLKTETEAPEAATRQAARRSCRRMPGPHGRTQSPCGTGRRVDPSTPAARASTTDYWFSAARTSWCGR